LANSTILDTSVGGLFTFDATSVSSQVRISWISKDKACKNLNDEIPEDTDFSKLVEDTKNVWNSEVLSKITTTTTNATNLELLYTSLYFMNLSPTNQTGENPGWTSAEPYYSDTFTL
jgi:putative alpha-1,2-mannosidase